MKKKVKTSFSDPVELMIEQEVEEFLRDLTLEYPFPEIFETLRRHEFKDRFGVNVLPLPPRRFHAATLSEIQTRIADFKIKLKQVFGSKHDTSIHRSFKTFTRTTVED